MDIFSKKKRSEVMKAIKSHDTKAEVMLSKGLWRRGYRFRKNVKDLPGKPDIAIKKFKVAVFADSEFFHGKNWNEKKVRIRSNRDYWIPKIERNMARDKKANDELSQMGYAVLRFWDQEVKRNLPECLDWIEKKIQDSRERM